MALENINVRNVTIDAKKSQNKLKEKTNVYMAAVNKKKRADEEASKAFYTLNNVKNSSGRFIEQRDQLEATKTQLELNISGLENDEIELREELDPVQEEARIARDAVDHELADMDLPPKHQNGLKEGAFLLQNFNWIA